MSAVRRKRVPGFTVVVSVGETLGGVDVAQRVVHLVVHPGLVASHPVASDLYRIYF